MAGHRGRTRGETMLRATILFAVALCATVLIGLPAMAQAPTELTLTRIDCGTGATPTDVGQRFSDTFAYKDLKLTFTFSCYLIKHGGDYMVLGHGLRPRHESQSDRRHPARHARHRQAAGVPGRG